MKNGSKTLKVFLKIMRLSFYQLLLSVFACTWVLATNGNAQELLNRRISVSIENQNVESAIRKISKAASVRFVYSPQLIRADRKVNLNMQDKSLSDVLESLLKPLQISYEVAGSQILLRTEQVKQEEIPQANSQNTVIDITVGGTVTDEKNEGIPGVSVALKNTTRGTTTDANGKFSLSVVDESSVLVFSFLGYEKQEIAIGSRKIINLQLRPDPKSLQEVVVVGYGEQRKETLTGSVVTINEQVFKNRGPVSNPLSALQGQVPGVVVTRNSAQPGREQWNFQMRGASSVNNSDPLVIIDGVPVPGTSALNSLNPNDIDNISFLKDAAASIYGSRAAGGVVLITTKRAKTGKPTVEYSAAFSQKKIGLQPDLVRINDWWGLIREARTNDGFPATDIWNNLTTVMEKALAQGKQWLTPAEYQALSVPGAGLFGDVKDFPFFDQTMQDVLWGNAHSQEHQLSVASRGEKAGYRVSLGYLNDGSLLQWGNNSNKRYNLRLTHDYSFSNKLKLATNISVERQQIVQPTQLGSIMNNGIQQGMPLFNQKGQAYVWGSGIGNASQVSIATFGGDNKEANTRLNTNLNLTYNATPNLKLVGTAGYYLLTTDYRTFENNIPFYDYTGANLIAYLPSRSSYQRGNKQEAFYSANAYAEFSKQVAKIHDFKLTAGLQYERNEYNRFIAKTLDAIPNVPNSLNLSTGDPTTKTVSEAQNHYAIGGYFSRLNYALKDKYLLEANARYDGSSKFDAQNRWKGFWGVSIGWRVTQEKFMQNIPFLDDLKIRASYGSVGNQNGIGLYDYIQFMNINFSPGATSAGFPILGTSPAVRVAPSGSLVALDRTWEKVINQNIGVDFALLKNRLYGTLEFFKKNNNNMLIARTYSAVLGANAPDGNNGTLETKGWELSLGWRDKIGNLSYHISGNLSDNTNMLVGYGGQKIINSANRGLNGAVEGYPLNTYFGLVYDGRIQSQEQLEAYRKFIAGNNIGLPAGAATAQANARLSLGDNMFKDVNGDGKLTFPEDAVALGRDDPRFIYSFNGGFEWKGFDFNAIFQGVGKRTIIRDGNWRIPAAVIFQAQNTAFLGKTWSPTNTDAFYPRLSTTGTINNYNYYQSDWIVEDGSYIRLKNVVLGYTLPGSLTQKAKIQRLRVYFSGSDLWEKANIRDGWDPEATRSVANTGDGENNNVSTFSQRFPFYRYMTLGLNLTF
ncbi:SusC/RagA family TonB-linked outer membrane protein [Runella aurantiaca]|uniref:SusC/RagA family TonB-linked outer membrane protein n=2 Tax=Runella aurantiaca TaxID=2282308 RepID=A0A369I2U3_9BACT|nr:SusC/RagA family TonB-linked outer membrane protein [Runella aurantiaca]